MRAPLRLLPLSLSIAVCLPGTAIADDKPLNWALCPAGDVIPPFNEAPPSAQPGDPARDQQPTVIEGDQQSGTRTTPQIQGNVALTRGDQFLGTDEIRMDTETGDYMARGNVRYQDSGIRIVADRAEGNQNTDIHTISDIQYQLVDRRGNGGADSIRLTGPLGRMQRSTYSTCDPSQQLWELRAQQIDVDSDEGFGVARNAVLRLGNIPFLYVPWFKFPIDDRRQTGLLYPAVSMSSRNGFDYRQPIYLNLAPNYDMTLMPRWMSKRGLMLDSEFRYLYEGGRGVVNAAYMPNDDLRDRDRGRFLFSGYHNIDEHWQARANLGWVSDTRYVEDFANRLAGISASYLQSTAGIYGVGAYWTAGAMAEHFQLTDYTLTDDNLPYSRLPRVYVNWERPLGQWLDAGVWAEAVHFQHSERPGGSRFDVKPYIAARIGGPAWYVNPTLAWRYTSYQLDDDLAQTLGGDTSPARSMPITTLDAGMYFDRDTTVGDTDYLHTLEPRLFYLNAPYREQDGLPLFDTRPFTFSWGQLFRDNRYSGADRQTDANQLTVALSTRLIRQADGREKLSASIGQIRYFEDSRVVAPGELPVEEGKSAWVADGNYAINDRWNLGASYQWDPKFRREDLASVRARYLWPGDGVVNVGYRYRRDLLEQADFNFLYPINPVWSVVGRYYYSIDDDKLLEAVAGVQWDSCCLAVRALARRYVRNREGELDNSIQFEFVLKGLGSAGQDTERTLRRAILGYYRDDLYLVPPSNTTPDPDAYDPNIIP
ncbi:LPS assembly protein LptD [Pseudoxanthomonas daejeonensis]|uniref:LPS assembly protein LptD n=1 Tax=Pseudoxanthomonas daejeonensis TaxID=266062 RepID=UPI00192ECB7D|nr:LPS assembly protein LptD [Pseudoxanthomonas daejeonensis]UNK56564.1 LPS assembly protein LptD [Pseudoxanthomonas daejeonensis]